MKITVRKEILEEMVKLFPDKELIYEPDRWYNESDIELKFLAQEELDKLIEIYTKEVDKFKSEIENYDGDADDHALKNIKKRKRSSSTTLNTIKRFIKLRDSKDKKLKNIKDMTQALIVLIQPLERKWIFVFDNTSKVNRPYFVTSIQYDNGTRGNYPEPAHIEFRGKAMYRDGSTSFSKDIHREDLGNNGSTPEELLNNIGIFLETELLIEEYEEHIVKYDNISTKMGLQLIGHGKCYTCPASDDRWSRYREEINLDKGGADTKLIVDDEEERDSKPCARAVSSSLWATEHGKDGENEIVFELPIHPYIRTFNLKVHEFMEIHIKNTEIYEYSTQLADKLVLDDDKRELIDLLVSSGGDDSQDIVQGKSGGVIIITSGPPGTGKTLTSEVFSEKVERPLYVVQCSQLGTKPDELEKHLQEVLDRAVRWNAVLLIDEADVYIRERAKDIKQNAIVGVFLRVLEYYSGVLFLTTNRIAIVDDAIISRCIAHVKYEVPNADESLELWKILSKQYEASFDDDLCKELADEFAGITGRSIKQLIRLSKALSVSRKEPITLETIKWVAKFQHLEEVKESINKKYPVKS